MASQYGYKVWLPAVVTLAVWIGLLFFIAALLSNMWADLIGLLYLLASPFIYRGLKSIIGVDTSNPEPNLDRSGMGNAGR